MNTLVLAYPLVIVNGGGINVVVVIPCPAGYPPPPPDSDVTSYPNFEKDSAILED